MQQKKYDVIIIGRGITGLSTAWHLQQKGCRNILLIGPDRTQENCTSANCSYVFAGMVDNVTRIAHAHSLETAKQILDFSKKGFDIFKSLSGALGLNIQEGTIKRFSTSKHETDEMKKAVETLQSLGVGSHLKIVSSPTQGILAEQIEHITCATANIKAFLAKLEKELTLDTLNSSVLRIEKDKHQKVLVGDHFFETEFVVLATHLQTANLLPELSSILVSYADQVTSFKSSRPPSIQRGDLQIYHHGHYMIWLDENARIYTSGARFLRKWAGVEAKTADVLPKVTEHLIETSKHWLNIEDVKDVKSHALLECKPCDELPIVGPMFGNERILVSTGYSGSGIALGCAAGDALADIILNGKSDVPQILEPKRLRSL